MCCHGFVYSSFHHAAFCPQDTPLLTYLTRGWHAVTVQQLDSSRLARELDVPLFSVDWGMRGPGFLPVSRII